MEIAWQVEIGLAEIDERIADADRNISQLGSLIPELADKGYATAALPTARTLRTKLNDLGFHLTKVAKCKPKKRSSRPTPSSRS